MTCSPRASAGMTQGLSVPLPTFPQGIMADADTLLVSFSLSGRSAALPGLIPLSIAELLLPAPLKLPDEALVGPILAGVTNPTEIPPKNTGGGVIVVPLVATGGGLRRTLPSEP